MLPRLIFTTLLCTLPALAEITVTPQSILKHDDKEWLWFHPRAAAVPGLGVDGGPRMVLTLQRHLDASDFYGGLYYMLSDDLGKTWTKPTLPPALDWIVQPDGEIVSVCDVTPQWHAASGKVIALGIKVRYRDGLQQYEKPRSHDTAYALYDPKADTWTKWQMVDTPEPEGKFYMVGPGCSQWVEDSDGSLLVPFYYRGPQESPFSVTVMRCTLEGETLRYRGHGDEMHLADERGLVEPSLIKLGDTYYLTLRNDLRGYVTRSKDGLHYEPFKPWTFDDGQELGSYNTQQHWLIHGDKLYLSYTRRGANNDHIVRHRAPIFMAEVNRDTLQVIRSTEIVVVPEAGAEMGNFGATAVTADESWVTVSEGVWDDAMRQRGADGDTWVAHIYWNGTAK